MPFARLAPTPSGYLHAGNAANFAANALLAGKDGRLLLRIDDLDRSRYRRAYVDDIFATIEWLGIEVTDGPRNTDDFERSWSQETRMPLYYEALDYLRHTRGPALRLFACPCSRKELSNGRHAHDCLTANIHLEQPGVAWRIDTRGLDLHNTMPDFAIRKKDGRPSYQLACTVDDLHFGITHCARGVDLLASTAAQALLSDLLGYPALHERINFIHHPLLTDAGKKISKSAGAKSVTRLRDGKWTPHGIFELAANWLARAQGG